MRGAVSYRPSLVPSKTPHQICTRKMGAVFQVWRVRALERLVSGRRGHAKRESRRTAPIVAGALRILLETCRAGSGEFLVRSSGTNPYCAGTSAGQQHVRILFASILGVVMPRFKIGDRVRVLPGMATPFVNLEGI